MLLAMHREQRVIWHTTMSLDGFIRPADEDMDRLLHEHATKWAGEIIASAGAVLTGRLAYDRGVGKVGGEPYGGAANAPVFVLTHRPPDGEPPAGITFLHCDVKEAVTTARRAAGDKNVMLFGADVSSQCVELGLADEIVVHVVPVLLGDGTRLYSRPDEAPVRLRRVDLAESDQLTDLRFEVLRAG